MLSAELQSDFFSKVPNQITLKEYNINIHKRYANQFVGDEFPAITLLYYNTGVANYIYLNGVYKTTDETTEQFTYDMSQTYQLEVPMPAKINEVKGFVEGDLVVVNDDYYSLVNVGDEGSIEFYHDLDEGTSFSVTYKHDKIRAEYGGEFSDYVQIDVYSKDLKVDEDYINGIILNKAIVHELKKNIRFNIDDPEYVIRDVSNTNDFSNISGEDYAYRRQFDVEIAYHDTFTKYHDKMKEVNYMLNTQVR